MILLRTPRWTLERAAGSSIARVRRSAVRTAAIAELEEDSLGFERALPVAERAPLGLLVDLREGPLRNDPEFEQALARLRPRFFGGFRAVAVLVRTAVGALQVTRQAREQGQTRNVFTDEAAAIAHLRAALRPNAPV